LDSTPRHRGIAIIAGIVNVWTSLIGYDLGRRREPLPDPARWVAAPIWEQLIVGIAVLAFGVYHVRAIWRAKS
jgi:hypothetical protein